MNVIGFAGPAGSGKSTAACSLLTGNLPHTFLLRSFADPIRDSIVLLLMAQFKAHSPQATFDEVLDHLLGEKKDEILPGMHITTRQILRDIGDLWRQYDPNVFINYIEASYQEAHKQYSNACLLVDDVRYPDEAKWIKSKGGTIYRLQRDPRECRKVSGHSSEVNLPDGYVDAEIDNDSDVLTLTRKVQERVEFIMDKHPKTVH